MGWPWEVSSALRWGTSRHPDSNTHLDHLLEPDGNVNFPSGVEGLTRKVRSLAGFSPTKQPLGVINSGKEMKVVEGPLFKEIQTPTAEKPRPIHTGLRERDGTQQHRIDTVTCNKEKLQRWPGSVDKPCHVSR